MLYKSYYVDNLPYSIMTWNKLYDTKSLKINSIRCIPYHINEDVLFSIQLAICCRSFVIIDKITYYWYINSNGTSSNLENKGASCKNADQFTDVNKYLENTYFVIKKCIVILVGCLLMNISIFLILH